MIDWQPIETTVPEMEDVLICAHLKHKPIIAYYGDGSPKHPVGWRDQRLDCGIFFEPTHWARLSMPSDNSQLHHKEPKP